MEKNIDEWKKDFYEVTEKLDKVFKERDLLDKQITVLHARRDMIVNSISTIKLSSIPTETPEKITKGQWEWLLHTTNNDGQVRYKARNAVIESLGFYAFGYNPEVSQPAFSISKYTSDKIKEGFKVLAPHLKPVTVTDRIAKTTETGIRFSVTDIKEDITSVLYVHKNGKCTLYITKYETKKFDSFDEFWNWYKIRVAD